MSKTLNSNIYSVSDYLLDRLSQAGIQHVFGVPGDYNLRFLDFVTAHPQLEWVGCANELNAAYAADGYARCAPAAALVTTFGVGELSAINGTAGSYAEYLPVIHIVGAPNRRSQQKGELLHHTLGDGDYGHFYRMAAEVTCSQAVLTPENAALEIDRVLSDVLYHRRPGYILLPSDVCDEPIRTELYPFATRQDEVTGLSEFIQAACELLKPARKVALLADFLADRFGQKQRVQQLSDLQGVASATLLMGKGVLDESRPNFIGTYAGGASQPKVKAAMENADVLISVGVRLTDSVTAGFTHQIAADKTIDLQPFSASVAGQVFSQLPMGDALAALTELAKELSVEWQAPESLRDCLPESHGNKLDQPAFWQQMQRFLRPDDIVVAEQGTASFGSATLRLPKGVTFIVQPLWGSIGYTLPAILGAQLAQPHRRVVLMIGDGSAQLTIQELGTLLRHGLKPVIILLNNDGYTVERAIHGPEESYNDIAAWNWTKIPSALSVNGDFSTYKADSVPALEKVLSEVNVPKALTLIEVMLPKMDVPEYLAKLSKAIAERNAAHE